MREHAVSPDGTAAMLRHTGSATRARGVLALASAGRAKACALASAAVYDIFSASGKNPVKEHFR
jgi:hypothetical protein